MNIGMHTMEIIARDGDLLYIEGASGIVHMITTEHAKALG